MLLFAVIYPFNPSTSIEFSITSASEVWLVVYDIPGNKISALLDENKAAGIFTKQNLTIQVLLAVFAYIF